MLIVVHLFVEYVWGWIPNEDEEGEVCAEYMEMVLVVPCTSLLDTEWCMMIENDTSSLQGYRLSI